MVGSQVPGGWPANAYRAGAEPGHQHAVVAAGEQGGVVVGRRAPHDQHVRLADVPGPDAADQAAGHQRAHGHVVEADVVGAGAAQRHPVVVDHLDARGGGRGFDGGTDARVDRVQQQHRRALGHVRLGLGLLGGVTALGVGDDELAAVQPGQLQRPGQVRRVEFGVPGRGGGVRQQHADLAAAQGGQAAQPAQRREAGAEIPGRDGRDDRAHARRGAGRAAWPHPAASPAAATVASSTQAARQGRAGPRRAGTRGAGTRRAGPGEPGRGGRGTGGAGGRVAAGSGGGHVVAKR